KDAVDIINSLAKYNLELQAKRKELLLQNGFPADFLQPHYTCAVCEDTGAVDGKECACYQKLLRDIAFRELSAKTPLQLCTFDSFSLSYYQDTPDGNGIIPRQKMEEVLNFCKRYADTFSLQSPSLLFFGNTGLGKTHLSLAIAAAAIEKGYGVVYGAAQNLFSALEKEHFGKSAEEDIEAMLLDCDLLILDDLGTEFTTGFVTASFYNIINTRLLCGKPTVINTNLSFEELEDKYTNRIVSRILGCYQVRRFYGEDMRVKKRFEQK
ncbi:MAG: ATP-binding protein, partial [Candidatus Fimenecus sp.]